MKTLSISDLNQLLKNLSNDDLILDVRTPKEYSEGHIPGAANIPVDQVMIHAADLKKYSNLYVYCRAGARAQTACSILSSMGVEGLQCVAEGGFPNWEQAGFPVEKA